MYYVYFVLCGYRVAIGKAANLYKRLTVYHRTHRDVFVLGVIPYKSNKQAQEKEKACLKRFEDDNAFRDMFYLSSEMYNWIVENTKDYQKYIKIDKKLEQERNRKRHHNRYQNDPKYRENSRKRIRNHNRDRYQNNSKYRESEQKRKREYERDRYQNDPEYREQKRKKSQKSRTKKRTHRPLSSQTLSIPGLE